MIVQKILKSIQDDVKIGDEDSEDPRYTFLLDEYDRLIDEGADLEPWDDQTTFGEIKERLTNCGSRLVLELLMNFQNEFLTPKERKQFNNNTMMIIILGVSLCLIVLVVLTSLLFGIVTGSLDPSAIFSSFFNFISPALSSPDQINF